MKRTHWLVRLGVVLIGLAGLYVGLVMHLYRLQIVRHEELYGKARREYTTRTTEIGQRGRIFDAVGNLLAGNLACRDILAEPRHFTASRGEVIAVLSSELGIEPSVLARRFARADDPVHPRIEMVVARDVDIRLAEQLDQYEFTGIRSLDTYARFYPKGYLLSNLLGFLDPQDKGASGIEQLMDAYLQPTRGEETYERDCRGHRLERVPSRETMARDGWDVYLTVHEPIQQIVEEELAAMVKRCAPKAAYAVMSDPATGAIMALAQYPNFDPNHRATMANPDSWRNRVLTDGFEPGSVMKCIAVCGALDYGLVDLDTSFYCEQGSWRYARRTLHDCSHSFEDLTVAEIIQKSSNIGTAKIALEMGPQRLYQVLRRFGFGQPTGLGFREFGVGDPILFPSEASGILRDVSRWDSLSITRFPIGQGVLVTPLQLVQAYDTLANDGVMMQPYIIDHIQDPRTGEERYSLPRPKGRAVRPEATRKIVSAMKLVTQEGGTATRAAVEGYAVAGKTGTAQKWINNPNGRGGHYSHSKCVSSFIGFVPADDPAFVLLVVADEVSKGSRYGGTVAAPVFSRIAERTLRYLQVAPISNATAEYRSPAAPDALAAESHPRIVR